MRYLLCKHFLPRLCDRIALTQLKNYRLCEWKVPSYTRKGMCMIKNFTTHRYNDADIHPLIQIPGSGLFTLKQNESALFELLNKAADNLAKARNLERLDLRVAGGWVRDKILSLETSDVDVATEKVTGEEMAQEVRALMLTKYNLNTSMHLVRLNPEKSKHIESASIKIGDIMVDFTQLRNESYTKDSRTPITEPGDCRTDALRRDLTINSLFYNLRTGQVEDYIGSAFKDIQEKRAKTPTDPLITFTEDPLRILRLIRFTAKFELQYDNSLLEAALSEDIKSTFRLKVSKERIRAEVFKMFENVNRNRVASELVKFGLYEDIFTLENKSDLEGQYAKTFLKIVEVLSFLYMIKNSRGDLNLNQNNTMYKVTSGISKVVDYLPTNEKDIALLYVAAAFYPIVTNLDCGRRSSSVEEIVMKQLKTGVKEASWIRTLIAAPVILDNFHPGKNVRLDAGCTILSLCNRIVNPEKWEQCVVFATAAKTATEFFRVCNFHDKQIASFESYLEKVAQEYGNFLQIVEHENLRLCHEIKSCVKGDVICKLLSLKKPGSIISKIKQKVVHWQIDNPRITPEQCEKRIVREFRSRRT